MSDIRRVVDELDMMEEYMVRMGELCYKGDQEVYREHARIIADAREVLDQLRRDVDALERVRDGRAVKIFHRGVVMINFDWWRRLLEAEGKWRCVPEIEDLEKADAEALSVAAATSPPEGETRGEAAGWIRVEDRLPEGRGEIYAEGLEDSAKVLAACITQDGRRKCGLATYVRDHELPEDSGWCGIINETEEIDDRHAKVTHWMPLPELPEVEA